MRARTPCPVPLAFPILFAAAFMIVAAAGRASDDDFQTWYTASVKWLDTKYVDLAAAGHLRITDDSSEFSLWRVGQEVDVHPLSWLGAGVAYRYTEQKNSAGEFRHQHRSEFALTPKWEINDRFTLSLRNQFELRWNERVGDPNERIRHRLQLNIATPKWKPLHGFFVSDEVFYDFDDDRISENRVVPVGVNFRLHEKANLSLSYMLRWVRSNGGWDLDHVLGTSVSLSL